MRLRTACNVLAVVAAALAGAACSPGGDGSGADASPDGAAGECIGCGSPDGGPPTGDSGDVGVAVGDDGSSPRPDASAGSDAGGGPGALGYMVGIKTNGDPNGPAKVEAWLGRPLDIAGATITTTSWISTAPYVTSSGAHPLLEVSFPLLSIFGESNHLDDLAQAAAGAYDSTYEAMAQALASWPNPLLSARIGWELNGTWYAWSNGVGTNATYASYVAAFKRAAQAIRKYNPHALIQWCIAWGQADPTPYWPGAYDPSTNPGGVDVVSIDFYQANISQYDDHGQQSPWAMAQSDGTIDVDWMVSFAKQQGVKIALSEYGAGSPGSGGEGSGPGLDDGAWTAAAIQWMNGLPPGFFLWTDWSDDAPADDIVTAGANPDEQAAWLGAWKGTHYAGNWWKGASPP